MQTIDELKYSQSIWGFQPRKAEIRRVCDVKGLLRDRNHLDVCKDRFRQRCQIVPLVRKTLKCPDLSVQPMFIVNCGHVNTNQALTEPDEIAYRASSAIHRPTQ